MAKSINRLSRRRARNLLLFILTVSALTAAETAHTLALRRSSILTGWLLFALVLILAAYHFRKRIPVLPLGSAATWLQFHIYAGLLTFVVFLQHVQWRIPNGIFESLLAAAYLGVFFSGLFGLVISRVFPRRLTARGGEVIFDQIPRKRRVLRAQVEELVLHGLVESNSTALPELYAERLRPFFSEVRDFWPHLMHSARLRNNLLLEMEWQSPYMNERERAVAETISQLIREKDDLDYHYAHQAALKYWLFAHVPLTHALLVFACAHAAIVYAYSGGLR
ncbi:MAG: hypothetical protein N2C14_24085 [Planctomycetales bacterium]